MNSVPLTGPAPCLFCLPLTSADCPYEWFHFGCVGLTEENRPKGEPPLLVALLLLLCWPLCGERQSDLCSCTTAAATDAEVSARSCLLQASGTAATARSSCRKNEPETTMTANGHTAASRLTNLRKLQPTLPTLTDLITSCAILTATPDFVTPESCTNRSTYRNWSGGTAEGPANNSRGRRSKQQ